MLHRRTAVPCLLVLLVLGSLSATVAAEPKKITSIEGITEYRLDNGLKVLLFADPSKATVTVNLTVFVGSRHEGYGEAGMAHLLEHMVFKGTPTHPDVPKALQSRGARFNGTTWVDRTNYYETLPASDENLEFAIRLEADRMVNSLIKAEDLASEMTVVRNEFERGENVPKYVLSQRMMATAYEWHNYGRSTIGNRADIERVPVKNLRVFYEKHYQPDNAMLVVAGRFDPEKALAYAQKYFGAIPRPKRKLDATYTEEPPQDGERLVTLRRVGDVAVVGVIYHVMAGPHPEYASLDVLESILTQAPAGRLYKALVETKKAADIEGSAYPWHDPGVLEVLAEVTQGNSPDVVLDTMLDVIEAVGEKGVSQEEVDRAKQRLLKQVELAATDTRRIAIQLSEWAAQGDWRLYFLYRDRLEKVTVESVTAVAKKYLRRNNRTVGIYLPTKEPQRVSIPPTPDLAEMIGDYKGREVIAAGEVFDVSPANIEKRSERRTLPGGIKAVLLPKKTRGEVVNLRLTLRYGNEDNLKGLSTAADFLPSLMTRGTKKLDRQQIQDELDKYRARLGASGSAGSATFTVSTKRENLPAVLALLQQVLREPTLPENELAILKQASLSRLEQQQSNPQSLATNAVSRHINPYDADDPRYVPAIDEQITRTKSVTRADVERLYGEFLGARDGELTIVGDFDPKAILPRIETILSGWKPAEDYARIARTAGVKAKGGARDIETPDKANAIYFAAMALPIRDDDPDYPALVIGNYILGGGSLSSRLGNRVRQKEGLSYGVGSMLRASSLDDRGTFYIYAISNPQNIPKVKTVIQEELAKLLKNGITEEELENARKGYLDSQNVARTDDSSLASLLESTAHVGRDMSYYAERERKIRKLTTKDVLAALRKHLDTKRLYIVAAGDFSGKPKSASPQPEGKTKGGGK